MLFCSFFTTINQIFMDWFKDYTITQWDSFKLINKLKDNSVDLIITSPPYNVWKVYEKRKKLDNYLEPYKEFAKVLFKKLSNKGSVCWQVWNYVEDWEVFPLDIYYYNIFKEAWFKLRNRIIWHFGHWLHAKNRFSWRYETILRFTKTDDYTFNLDDVRVPSKYPWKLHYKWPKKWLPSWNPLWKNPSDFWKTIEEDWNSLIWEIPNVKSNHPEKTTHPCQFPVELVQRCIMALTNEKDLVFDPFLWVGSTIIGAVLKNRKWLGFEYDKSYIKLCNQRLKDINNGIVKIRQIWTPIHKPTWNEKMVKMPVVYKDLSN